VAAFRMGHQGELRDQRLGAQVLHESIFRARRFAAPAEVMCLINDAKIPAGIDGILLAF
jgi:hypothetical protein